MIRVSAEGLGLGAEYPYLQDQGIERVGFAYVIMIRTKENIISGSSPCTNSRNSYRKDVRIIVSPKP